MNTVRGTAEPRESYKGGFNMLQPGTIIMLLVIVVGFFGCTGLLIKKNLSNEKTSASEDKP